MIAGRLHIDAPLPVQQALGRGRSLWEAQRGPEARAACTLYAAPLGGRAAVVGAYQHVAHALAADRLDGRDVVRRATGGIALEGSEGVLYAALALPNASALMACPPGRILNRNVRGLLQGVRALAVPAHYFGRDFVSFAGQPGAYVAYAEAEDGGVLLEFFIGLSRPFALAPSLSGYPAPSEPPFRGKTPISLREAGARADAEPVLQSVAEGYARLHKIDFRREAPTPGELRRADALAAALRVDPAQADALRWSRPRPEAIGFVSAGVALDHRGQLAQLVLAGDFMQNEACPPQLRARLLGGPADETQVGAALDAVYAARPGLIEGVRSLLSLRDAIVEAADHARSTT